MDIDYSSCPTSHHSTTLTTPDSPPSLTYSEFSTEDIEEIMAAVQKEDASVIMATILGHLDRVAEHLRDKGENEAANQIAHAAYTMIETFNSTTAAWDMEKYLMHPPIIHHRDPTPSGRTMVVPQYNQFKGNSWAAVAATAATDDNRLIKFRPSDTLKKIVSNQSAEADEPSDERDMRVVWVQPWDPAMPLNMITEAITQGPLLSMAYSNNDNAVCIIFQHASHARNFLEDNAYYIERYGHSMLGPSRQVLIGLPYSYNEELRHMEPPTNARRRLTFARSQLFTGSMNEEQFRKELYGMVGENNVELVWLFNTGNATVVFSATSIARIVREGFRKRAKLSGPFKDIQVSFSHDPCERPLHLVTQMHQGQNTNRVQGNTGYGNPSSRPNSNLIGNGAQRAYTEPSKTNSPTMRRARSVRNKKVDDEGWQTVARKR